jgi:hypothetical protein
MRNRVVAMLGGALLGIGCGAAGPLSPEEEKGEPPPAEQTAALSAEVANPAAPAATPDSVAPSSATATATAKDEKPHYTITLTNAIVAPVSR